MIRLTILFAATLLISCTQKSTSDLISSPISSSDTLINRLKTESIGAIFEDSKGNLWLAGSQLYRVSKDTILYYSTNDGLTSNWIIDIQEDEAGNIYFDSPDGLSRFDGEKFSAIPIATGNDLDTSWQLNPSDLWFTLGWEHDGPFRYDGEFLHALKLPKSPQEDEFKSLYPNVQYSPYGLYSLYTDGHGNLWFGTSSLGICRYDGKQLSWMYEEELTITPQGGAFCIRSILQDSKGAMWFCTPRFKFDILPALDKNGNLAYHKQSVVRKPVTSNTESQGNEEIENGVESRKNEERKNRIDPRKNEVRENGIEPRGNSRGDLDQNSLYFHKMTEHQNAIWGITYFHGVYRITENEFENYPITIEGEPVHLQTMHITASDEILVGTKDHGVYQFDGQVFIPMVFEK